MSTSNTPDDIRQHLDERNDAAWELHEKSMYASAARISREVQRVARAERQLMPLLRANFHLMNAARNLLEPRLGQESAVENIALLESPERARQFQGDFDEAEYEHTVHWMTACSYDNLAVATADQHGYNSDGMQACISDGIGVCHRTGKTECVACFRQYASDVHVAADDLDMALHYARMNSRGPIDPRSDRRWTGADTECELLTLLGQLDAAWDAGQRAWELTSSFHSPIHARRTTAMNIADVAILSGRQDWIDAIPDITSDAVPPGEDPLQDLKEDRLKAARAALAGDYASAAKLLIPWDKLLTDRQNLNDWFELRLRVVALYVMAGQKAKAESVAKPLREKAIKSKDYLTLRRLAGLLEGTVPVLPIPLAAAPGSAPKAAAASETAAVADPAAAIADQPPATPLREVVDALTFQVQEKMQAIAETGSPQDLSEQINAILAHKIAPAYEDATALIHLSAFASGITQSTSQDVAVWNWANTLQKAHAQNGPVLNALARLADVLREKEGSPLAAAITAEQIGQWYKRSLDLDSNQPNGFARAGDFFLQNDELGEAERCYARAFRLNRSNNHVARQLGRIYAHTDRGPDALAVLDMCLREGGESPDLLFEAAQSAFQQSKHQQVVSYLDRLLEIAPGGRWANYYRASSLLELGRPADALAAVDAEGLVLSNYQPAEGEPTPTWLHIHCLRAAALASQNRWDEAAREVELAMAIRLCDIGDLSMAGIIANMRKVYLAVREMPNADGLRHRVERRLLASGMMDDEYFETRRKQNPPQEELTHFAVTLRQDLGPDWSKDDARAPGYEGWTEAAYRYGILSPTEEDAVKRAIAAQSGLFANPPEVLAVEPQGGPFHDHPGVAWIAGPMKLEEAE